MRFLHYQWLSFKDLDRDLKRILPTLSGSILDVGCGSKPYEPWCSHVDAYTGVDIYAGDKVDYVIDPHKRWPFPDASFDAVLCTQVIEHVEDPEMLMDEIHRALKPNGTVVLSAPFCYQEHGAPHDFRRFSVHGIKQLLGDRFIIVELTRQGGIGSTLGTLYLHYVQESMNRNTFARLLFGLSFPLWLLMCAVTNVLGLALDHVDSTESFYGNVLVVSRKTGGRVEPPAVPQRTPGALSSGDRTAPPFERSS